MACRRRTRSSVQRERREGIIGERPLIVLSATLLSLTLFLCSTAPADALSLGEFATQQESSALTGEAGEGLSSQGFVGREAPATKSSGLTGLAPLIAGEKGQRLQYGGGPVQHEPALYLIFWGDDFWNGTAPSGLYSSLKHFYEDLALEAAYPSSKNAYQGILSQYWSYAQAPYKDARIAGEWDITTESHPTKVTEAMLETKVGEWINSLLAEGKVLTQNAQFVVLLAPGTTFGETTEQTGCGYHSPTEKGYGEQPGHYKEQHSFSFIPYTGDDQKRLEEEKSNASCNRLEGSPTLSTEEQWLYTTVSRASHEFAESVTDPKTGQEYRAGEEDPYTGIAGWVAEGGDEIADECILGEEKPVELPATEGRSYSTYVNELWDDQATSKSAEGECKLQDPSYPQPPFVETKQATSINEAGATLNGVVNPNKAETKYYFEYGTAETYGSKTAEANAGSGTGNIEESKAVTGLTLGATYDFRITAANANGTTHGANQKLTVSVKPTVETKTATNINETEAILTGGVNPKGAATKYYFEYGTEKGKYSKTTTEENAGSGTGTLEESKAVTGLMASTTYYYRIAAKNIDGTTEGGEGSFSTSGAPSVETTTATSVGETTATLNGFVDPRDSETKYWFEYGTEKGKYTSKTAEASAGSGANSAEESKAVTGLTASTTYYFRIVAKNSDGKTEGSEGTFSTTAKPAVETKPATSVGETGATLNGTVNPKGVETKYYFEYGTTESYGSKTAEAGAGSGTSSLEESKAITGLTLGTTYDFRIVATNSNGTSLGENKTFTPSGLPSVETKAATSTGETKATLNGLVNPRGADTKYFFEYGTTSALGTATPEANIGSGTSSLEESHKLAGLTPSTTYRYIIVATNSHGGSEGSEVVFSTTGKPTVETGAATDVGEAGATLTGVVNPRGFETKYYFEYGTTESYGTKTAEASAGAGTGNLEVSKTITGLTAGVEYHFRLVAKSSKGTVDGEGTIFAYVVPKITEYAVGGSNGEPRVITPGPDGNLWFTRYYGGKIGKITPSGTLTEYALPKESYPEGIVAGPGKENALWFTDYHTNEIGKITTSGTITEYPLPEKRYPRGIAVGPDGNLWFTESGVLGKPQIGTITASGTITEYELPKGSSPAGIVAGPENEKALWFTEYGTSQIGRITTSGTITQYGAGGAPETITAGPDGNLWFTSDVQGSGYEHEPKIVKMTTSGVRSEYSLPEGSELSGIGGLTAGPEKENALWFTSGGGESEDQGMIGRISTSGTITEYLSTIVTPYGITLGPDGKLWFTGRSSGKIGTLSPP